MPGAKRRGVISRSNWKLAAFALAAIAVLAIATLLPVAEWGDEVEDRIEVLDFGAGLLLFAAIYFVATLLLIPAWIFPVAAGALFGFPWGLAVALATAMASATTAFLIARHLLRERVRGFARRYDAFTAVEKCMADDGWKMVALLRLSPLLPFGVKNYLFGTTRVRLAHYVLGTVAGILPGMLLKVYVGWAGRSAYGGEHEPKHWAMGAVGLAATAGAAYFVARMAKGRLKGR